MAKKTKSEIPAIPFTFGAIAFAGGFLIMFFGAALHNKYDYVATYNDPAHITVSPGLVILVGGIVATLGLIGMLRALLQRM